jgi:hypothetical protein
MVREAKRHAAFGLLRSIPGLGPVRAAKLVAVLDTPHLFAATAASGRCGRMRGWRSCGMAARSIGSRAGGCGAWRRRASRGGLNQNGNRRVKEIFKGAANTASSKEPFAAFYTGQVARGLTASVARVSLERKIAAVTLAVWKSGKEFDAKKLTPSTT